MALTTCQECKKEYSDTLKRCPHCGFKATKTKGSNKKKSFLWIFISIAIIVIAFFTSEYINSENQRKEILLLENKAQSYYVDGKLQEALDVYENILKSENISDEDYERISNKINGVNNRIERENISEYSQTLYDSYALIFSCSNSCLDFSKRTFTVLKNVEHKKWDPYNKGDYSYYTSLNNLSKSASWQNDFNSFIESDAELAITISSLDTPPNGYEAIYTEMNNLYKSYKNVYDVTFIESDSNSYGNDFFAKYNQYSAVLNRVEALLKQLNITS